MHWYRNSARPTKIKKKKDHSEKPHLAMYLADSENLRRAFTSRCEY